MGASIFFPSNDRVAFPHFFSNLPRNPHSHSEAALNSFALSINTANFSGVKSELVDPQGCKELIPALDISDKPRLPILGGMYHPPGRILRTGTSPPRGEALAPIERAARSPE